MRLGPVGEASQPVAVVPAGCWQAARSLDRYSFRRCTVGPGFGYADFEILQNRVAEAAEFKVRFPDLDMLL
ncbi:MAG: cupin domain-containing protein [Gammaproteobacteria bacterium]